jgi:hypothetical protein
MKKEEVHEIAKQAKATAYTNRFVKDTAFAFGPESLALFANEVERRTLERVAKVCESEWDTSEERWHGHALAAEIRALKEPT